VGAIVTTALFRGAVGAAAASGFWWNLLF